MENKMNNYKYVHKKVNMADCIPLDTPFTVVIEPTNRCNFKCSFCFHSLSDEELKSNGFTENQLSLAAFKKMVENISQFPQKLKVLRFSGFGEPLLNRELPEMIAYAKEQGIAERVMVISNGSCLRPELSRLLIEAGLDELLISVEGLSGEHYKKICAAELNYDRLIENIRYFYSIKKQCLLNARILNHNMTEDDCNSFYKTFEPFTDHASIDNIIPLFEGVDYSNIIEDPEKDIEGMPKKNLFVCVQPFNSMFIHASGNVSVCCVDYYEKLIFGNVSQNTLADIWRSSKLNQFRIMHLKKLRKRHAMCGKCDYVDYVNQDVNILDDHTEEILGRMNEK